MVAGSVAGLVVGYGGSEQHIEAVLAAYGFSRAASVAPVPGGLINETYLVQCSGALASGGDAEPGQRGADR